MFPTKIIFFVPIIITLLLLFNDFCGASLDNIRNNIEGNQIQSSDNVTTSSYNLSSDHSNAEIYSFYIFGILLYSSGVISTLYVMLRTYIRWTRNDLTLNMTHKLPFYMASSDFFIYVVQIINLTYPAVHFETWPDLSCKFVGASFFYFSISNMLLVGSLAILSHFKVCKKKYYDLGVLDYKLFIFPILLPIVLTTPGWNYFGGSDYWCYSNNNSKYIHITLLTVDMTILLISLYCYIGITYTINIAKLKVADEQFLAASRKIVGYLFMYILQWTPVMIYILIDFKQGGVQMWVFFVFFISLPLGGILNGYRYVSNEGWWVRPRGTKSTPTTSAHSSPDDASTSPSSTLPNSTGKQIVDDRRQNSYLVMVSKENGDYDGGNSVELKKIGIKRDNNDDIIEIGKAV